jgi:hypothetical protein
VIDAVEVVAEFMIVRLIAVVSGASKRKPFIGVKFATSSAPFVRMT